MNYSLSMKLLYMATIFFQHYNNSYTHQNIKYPGLLSPFACNLRGIGKK